MNVKKQTLSVAMMGAREWDIEYLPACLDSTKPIRDELVFIDTRSCNNLPVDLLKQHTDRIFTLPWKDFSTGRNQSILKCSGDWILIIDCDEELQGDLESLKKFLASVSPKVAGVQIPVKDIQNGTVILSFMSARVFRRGCIAYRGIVHNEPTVTGPCVTFDKVWINHYGYNGDSEIKAKKQAMTESLLKKRIADDPEDWKAYFYMVEVAINRNCHAEALEYAGTYIQHRKQNNTFNNSVFCAAAECAAVLNDFQKAVSILNQGFELIPDDLDLNHVGVKIGAAINNVKMVLECGQRYIDEYKKLTSGEKQLSERFTFSLNQDCYCFVLAQVGAIQLQFGKNNFKEIKRLTSDINMPVVMQELDEIFKRIGVTCAI